MTMQPSPTRCHDERHMGKWRDRLAKQFNKCPPLPDTDGVRISSESINSFPRQSTLPNPYSRQWVDSSQEWTSELDWERTFLLCSIQEARGVSDWGLIRRRILESPRVLEPIKVSTSVGLPTGQEKIKCWKEVQRESRGFATRSETQARCYSDALDECTTVYEPTILGALCTANMNCLRPAGTRADVITHQCTPMDVIHTILMLRPDLARCSQWLVGHIPLRAAVRNDSVSPEVLEWLVQAYPSSLNVPDQFGLTPLDRLIHMIHDGCPLDLLRLQSLLRYASKEFGRSKSPLLSLLSIGVYDVPSIDEDETIRSRRMAHILGCVRILLSWHPSLIATNSLVSGCSPLHVAVRNYGSCALLLCELLLSDANDVLIRHRNHSGDLVLHVACFVGVPLDVLQMILTRTVRNKGIDQDLRSHALIWSGNGLGYTPIDLVWMRHIDAGGKRSMRPSLNHNEVFHADALHDTMMREAVNQVLKSQREDFNKNKSTSLRSFALVGQGALLRRLIMIIRASNGLDSTTCGGGLDYHMLHQVANLCGPRGSAFPGPLLDLFTAIWSHQIGQKDQNGKMPLHYAVQSQWGTNEATNKSTEKWKLWVLKLLQEYPGACRVRDHRGRLPIHYALSQPDNSSSKVQDACNVVIMSMVDTFPLSIELVDSVTGLYPFQLAAANSLVSIETLYHLLRMSPNAIAP